MTTYTMFMLVHATPAWLSQTPDARFAFLASDIEPVLKDHAAVTMRFFDAEAFCGRVSDVIMWQTDDLGRYQSLVERLRETKFWGTYFEVSDIIPSIENAYARHYGVAPVGQQVTWAAPANESEEMSLRG